MVCCVTLYKKNTRGGINTPPSSPQSHPFKGNIEGENIYKGELLLDDDFII
jgi:hypothetical protein